MSSRFERLLTRFARISGSPDDANVALRKSTLLLSASLITILASVWVVTYWTLGLRLAALIPLIYQLISVASILFFLRTKRWTFFRNSQLFLMLLLPFLLQWTLGGFVNSSAVMLWALMAPIGGLVFSGPRRSVPWLAAFLVLTAISGVIDDALPPPEAHIPQVVLVVFFVLNLGTVSAVVYVLLRYFVRGRERALEALAHEHRLLETEKEKSERLLLNVLPAQIAERLKRGEEVIADSFDGVTVLFADIVGFTSFTERVSPGHVIAMLNEVFSAFDGFADDEGLEKIKTIGDAYMVAGGVPEPRSDHAEAVAKVALRMRDYVASRASESGPLAARIGISTGPVVAGVIGRRKFSYDMWGDTVNMASRMEFHGVPGQIQVTPACYRRLRDGFELEKRGLIEVKGKGALETYFLKGPKHL